MNPPVPTDGTPADDPHPTLDERLALSRAKEPGTADEIRERHRAAVVERAEEAVERARHVDEMADLYRFSDEIADRWHAQESRNDPYYEAVRALWYGPGMYWGRRQLRDKLTPAEHEVLFAVEKMLVANENEEMSDYEACRRVADRLGKAHRTVWNQYQAARSKVKEILKEATAA